MEGVKVVYVSRNRNLIARNIKFISAALKKIKSKNSLIFLNYSKVIASILKILRFKHIFILDIRSVPVYKNRLYRLFLDALMRLESKLFKYKTIISKGISEKMGFGPDVYILPLGAEIISSINKTFSELNLLYVGTLNNRNIEETILGFSKFYHENKNVVKMKYTIIGKGANGEEDYLKNIIKNESLTEVAVVIGEIPHWMLTEYFNSHNIGVSYIPMTDYYDYQPPTKTFEYLLSGMPVLATNTSANRFIINNSNGVLVNDDHESFYRGIVDILNKNEWFDSKAIRASAMKYSWQGIVKNLKHYLREVERANFPT
jgi:glycosyltransferase involved in cell wall biosynthesis